MDNAAGEYASDKVYDDAKVADIESIPETMSHRSLDMAIAKADVDGKDKSKTCALNINFC